MQSKMSDSEKEKRNKAALAFASMLKDEMLTAAMSAIMKKKLWGEHVHYDKSGNVDAVFAFTDGVCMHFNKIHNFGPRNLFKESMITDKLAQDLNKRMSNA